MCNKQLRVTADAPFNLVLTVFLSDCRKNAAYDFFPCQNQLFYRGKGKGGMW